MPELAELKFTSDYVNQVSEGATYTRVEKKCQAYTKINLIGIIA